MNDYQTETNNTDMTNRTGETVRMPALVASGSLRENGHLSSADGLRTILTQPNFLDLHRHFWNLGRDNRWRYFNPVAARTAVAAVAVRMRHGQSIVVHWLLVQTTTKNRTKMLGYFPGKAHLDFVD